MANRLTGMPAQPSTATVQTAAASGTARILLPRFMPNMRHSKNHASA